MPNLTLIGFSGTGKSTVARLLAERLGCGLLDLDAEVERAAGRPIPEIFARDGEAAFRRLEEQTLAHWLASREPRGRAGEEGTIGAVIALGGGATLGEEVRRLIAEAGLVVCLEARPATIVERLGRSGAEAPSERPLLAGGDPLAQVERLKASRASLYALADFTVHVDALTPEEAANEVLRLATGPAGSAALGRPGRIEGLTKAPPNLPSVVDAPGAATIVRTASADYPAYVDWGALGGLGEIVKRATGARRAFVISDAKVLEHWGEAALTSLREAGMEAFASALPPGDGSKSLASAGKAYGWLAEHRAERRDAIVALGGGMSCDLAGFVAATYLRGMPVVQAPTSLLAMVDASIGGKTGVNHAGAKNLVGAFYQPRAVVADVAALTTLPRREFVEGLGEVIKHALIRDPDLLGLLEERLDDLLALEPELTARVVRRNVQIKAEVVSQDERETGGVREILNYGHTLGHAFEAAGDYSVLLHGEAVAAGMTAAAMIGVRIGVTPSDLAERQRVLIERAGLPVKPPAGLSRERVREALTLDKKIVAGTQRWVLIEAPGRTTVRDDVPSEVVAAVMDELLAG